MKGAQPINNHYEIRVAGWAKKWLIFPVVLLLHLAVSQHLHAEITTTSDTSLDRLLASINLPDDTTESFFISESIAVSSCRYYPYHDNGATSGVKQLVSDLKAGLQQGLQCLSGQGQMGPLHPYHQRQAAKLIELLETPRLKLLQCVQDELFAYAIAASPQQRLSNQSVRERLKESPRLTILLDTYRIGGLLSQNFNTKAYHEFFKLNEKQITQHLMAKPLRMPGLHRYKNLPGLLFHEIVHWLGHTHSNIHPDLTFLYETCCFGGSEYIQDNNANADFQARACNILKDSELWEANRYQQTRLWHHKGYDQLKLEMRDYYQ
jgi:hypothetical protein